MMNEPLHYACAYGASAQGKRTQSSRSEEDSFTESPGYDETMMISRLSLGEMLKPCWPRSSSPLSCILIDGSPNIPKIDDLLQVIN